MVEFKASIYFLVFIFVYLSLILTFSLLTTFNTPISFGDEGFHSYVARKIAKNLEYPIYLEELRGNQISIFERPPLWNIFEAGFILILKNSDLAVRTLTPFLIFVWGLVIFVLFKRIFNEKIALFSAILTVSFQSTVIYTVTFYDIVLSSLFFTLFISFFLLGQKENNFKFLVLSAIFGGLAFLSKTSAIGVFVFYPLMFLYELIILRKNNFFKYLTLFLTLFLVTSGYFIRNYLAYGTPLCREFYFVKFDTSKCIKEVYRSEAKFEGRTEEIGSEANLFSFGLINYLNFAYGNLPVFSNYYFPIIFLVLGIILAYLKNYQKESLLILLGIFILLILNVGGRTEDTARHGLVFNPLIALFFAIAFAEIYSYSNKIKNLAIPIIFLVFLLVFILFTPFNSSFLVFKMFITIPLFLAALYFFFEKKYNFTIFISLLSLISLSAFYNFEIKLETMQQVKQFSPLFFEACKWVNENLPKNSTLMTIWAYRAIYNCETNVAGNLPEISVLRDLNKTLEIARKVGITHIFIQKFSIGNRDLAESQNIEFVRFLENNKEHFVKIFENPENDICFQQCLNTPIINIYGRCPCDGNIIYEIKFG